VHTCACTFCQCINQSYSSVVNLEYLSCCTHFYQSIVFFRWFGKVRAVKTSVAETGSTIILEIQYNNINNAFLTIVYTKSNFFSINNHFTVVYNLVHVVVIWNSQGFAVRLSTDLMEFTSSSQHLQIRHPNSWASKSKFFFVGVRHVVRTTYSLKDSTRWNIRNTRREWNRITTRVVVYIDNLQPMQF